MSYVFVDLTEDELAKLHALGRRFVDPPAGTGCTAAHVHARPVRLVAAGTPAAVSRSARARPRRDGEEVSRQADRCRRAAPLPDAENVNDWRDARTRVRTESVPRAGDALH